MKRLSDERIEYNLRQIEATMAMEGLIVTEEAKQLVRDCYKGKMTFDEAISEIIAKHKVTSDES